VAQWRQLKSRPPAAPPSGGPAVRLRAGVSTAGRRQWEDAVARADRQKRCLACAADSCMGASSARHADTLQSDSVRNLRVVASLPHSDPPQPSFTQCLHHYRNFASLKANARSNSSPALCCAAAPESIKRTTYHDDPALGTPVQPELLTIGCSGASHQSRCGGKSEHTCYIY
jgi:hypothetical protein